MTFNFGGGGGGTVLGGVAGTGGLGAGALEFGAAARAPLSLRVSRSSLPNAQPVVVEILGSATIGEFKQRACVALNVQEEDV